MLKVLEHPVSPTLERLRRRLEKTSGLRVVHTLVRQPAAPGPTKEIWGAEHETARRVVIEIDPDHYSEGVVAHEYLHAILKAEGYPSVYYRRTPRDHYAEFIGSAVIDTATHHEIYRRLRRERFDFHEERDAISERKLWLLEHFNPPHHVDEPDHTVLMALDAADLTSRRKRGSSGYFETLRRSHGEAYRLHLEILGVIKRRGCHSPLRARRTVVEILNTITRYLESRGRTPELLKRIFVLPLVLSRNQSSRKASSRIDVVSFHAAIGSHNINELLIIDRTEGSALKGLHTSKRGEATTLREWKDRLEALKLDDFLEDAGIPYVEVKMHK